MMNDLDRAKQALELYQATRSERITPDHAKILALVKAGVDVKATGNNNHTLLHWAAYYEHLEVCERLIEQGTKIDARSSFGNTSLHKAAMNGHTETVKFLLEKEADIHARDDGAYTPLHHAAISGNTKVIKFLLEHGAELHAREVFGRNPLHLAQILNKPEATTFLLARGANIWAVDRDKRAAWQITGGGAVPHHKQWLPKLIAVMRKDCSGIDTTQDIYHLASVMKPSNPQDIPHPKEFIRLLFQQYLPHEEKFNAMYAEIFGQSRPPEYDLKTAREAAKGSRGVVL